MRGQATEAMKMTMFYRYWCLKEAILKATGEGLVNDLSRYDFHIDPNNRYKQGCFLKSTTVLVDGKLQNQWVFEESFVDKTHAIAVCREKTLPETCMFVQDPDARLFFSQVGFAFLLHSIPSRMTEHKNLKHFKRNLENIFNILFSKHNKTKLN